MCEEIDDIVKMLLVGAAGLIIGIYILIFINNYQIYTYKIDLAHVAGEENRKTINLIASNNMQIVKLEQKQQALQEIHYIEDEE